MANFFLIDQSFQDQGGHHADYVQCVTRAAREMGFQVIVGAHRTLTRFRLQQLPELLSSAVILPRFKYTTYQKVSKLAGLRQMKRAKTDPDDPRDIHREKKTAPLSILQNGIQKLRNRLEERQRQHLIQQFFRDCSSFFFGVKFTSEDHIFFATVSDIELAGLARYLSTYRQTQSAHWHAQFHFNPFFGRPPEFEDQLAQLEDLKKDLTDAMAKSAYHNLSLYTTSDELTQQYIQLGVAKFETLTYPVAQEFSKGRISTPTATWHHPPNLDLFQPVRIEQTAPSLNADSQAHFVEEYRVSNEPVSTSLKHTPVLGIVGSERAATRTPLQVVCPGAIRREKGQQGYLQSLINEVAQPLLATQRIQFVIQQPERKLLKKEKLPLALPELIDSAIADSAIKTLAHPLPRKAYCEMIRSSDIGLLYYNNSVYYSRRAGILGELLAAGRPVIVPAGCWLAEQIAEPNFKYIDQYFANQTHEKLGLADVHWESSNVPLNGGKLTFDHSRHPFRFDFDAVAGQNRMLGIRFDWHWPRTAGVYCRIELEELNEVGETMDRRIQIVGHRNIHQYRPNVKKSPIAMFRIGSQTRRIRISLSNAYSQTSASIQKLQILCSSHPTESESGADSNVATNTSIPLGALGVTVPDQQSLGAGLQEIVNHYSHYRTSAENYSTLWYARHNPLRTVSQLISLDQLAAEVA